MSKVFPGQTVTFQALASTPGFSESAHSYSWNVDGTISGTNPTTASFATPGLRPATVTATNTITGSTATARIDVEVIGNHWSPSLACPYQMLFPTFAVLPNGNLFVCGDLGNYATCWETDGSAWVNRGTNPRPRCNENANKSFIYPALDEEGSSWLAAETIATSTTTMWTSMTHQQIRGLPGHLQLLTIVTCQISTS